ADLSVIAAAGDEVPAWAWRNLYVDGASSATNLVAMFAVPGESLGRTDSCRTSSLTLFDDYSSGGVAGLKAAPTTGEAVLQTRSLRQIRTLAEQGSLNVSQETLDMLRVLRQNGSRLEVAAADLPATLPRMAELQRAAQVEFALVQQEGRYFLIRGLPEEV